MRISWGRSCGTGILDCRKSQGDVWREGGASQVSQKYKGDSCKSQSQKGRVRS